MNNDIKTDYNENDTNNQAGDTVLSELSFSDKIVGVFTEPGNTFKQIAAFPLKTSDWLLPVLFLYILVSLSVVVSMQNPILKSESRKQQMVEVEKQLKNSGLSEEQIQQQLDQMEQRMETMEGPTGYVISSVSIFVFGFIFFFIISGFYFLFCKFILKGDGSFKSVLVVSGLTSYIAMLQVILITILSIAFDKWFRDVSVASFLGMEKTEFVGFLLSKLDIITIWVYAVMGIGLAKMFKSEDTKKYVIMVFAVWIGWSIMAFGLSKAVPFLGFLNK